MEERKKQLTLATLLQLLYELFLTCYKNQQELFAAIFRSYHQACSDANQCQWLTCQTTVAALLSGRKTKLPRPMQMHYAHRDRLQYIEQDMDAILADVLVTAQQRENLYRQLYHLAISSDNLNREDRDYILDCADIPERKVNELLYRMMVIAICNAR